MRSQYYLTNETDTLVRTPGKIYYPSAILPPRLRKSRAAWLALEETEDLDCPEKILTILRIKRKTLKK